MSEFNLSKKIGKVSINGTEILMIKDVKEFIKRLKENLNSNLVEISYNTLNYQLNMIDKLAGDELSQNCSEEEMCKCGHHTRDHSYNVDFSSNLRCDICNCKEFTPICSGGSQ